MTSAHRHHPVTTAWNTAPAEGLSSCPCHTPLPSSPTIWVKTLLEGRGTQALSISSQY